MHLPQLATTSASPALLALANLGLARSLPATVQVERSNVTISWAEASPNDGCTLVSYRGFDCSGDAANAWLFSTQGCRSCEAFDDCHSFFLSGNCPRGHLVVSNKGCGAWFGSSDDVNFGGTGCWNVNTGHNWVSGYPCFDA